MSAKVLVFGRQGQVARALAEARTPFELAFAGRDRLDLAAPEADVAALIAAERPGAVINAAAYTAVDRAEHEREACRRLNCDRPAQMAEACAAQGVPFVHFSTDYVFDGEKGAPYAEDDPPRPLNWYGRTKADGEAAIEALAARTGARLAVIRTSWVFAGGGGGFLGAMARAARERDEVTVVADQRGSPTPASACASAALTLTGALLDRDPSAQGLFHAAGRDGISRADFAAAIFARLPRQPRLQRVAASDYPADAARPRDTCLSSARLETALGWRPPALDAALDECLARLQAVR